MERGQAGGGDEAEAPGFQIVHDVESRLHGAVRHVVKQYHIPVLHPLQHGFLDGPGVPGGPVPGIHRPAQNGHPPSLRPLPHPVGALSPGGAEEYRLATFVIQSMATAVIFLVLLAFFLLDRKKRTGDTALLFLLVLVLSGRKGEEIIRA